MFAIPALILLFLLTSAFSGQGDSTKTKSDRDSVAAETANTAKATVAPGIQISSEQGKIIGIDQLGPAKIHFKDGTMKVACTIKEIHKDWIVYEKNGVLHDQMIDQICRVELSERATLEIIFDEKNKPKIVGREEEK